MQQLSQLSRREAAPMGSATADVKYHLKRLARRALAPLIYRYPPFVLAPERLYLLMHHLIETKDIHGAIVEIGCNLGGTAVIARRMLDGLRVPKRYVCIDTFDGFVGTQFATDVALGTPTRDQNLFSGNSKALVSQILYQHHCGDVELVQGDIVTVADEALPTPVSLVLLDVDLTEPTFVALERFWPRMSSGGVILVDDCAANSTWKAGIGYDRFCRRHDLQPEYLYGMGIIRC